MPTGSGLDAQVMFKAETTWGTAVTVDKAVEVNRETLSFERAYLEPTGLRVGTKYKRVARVTQSRRSAGGELELELATKGMLTLIKHMLGAPQTAPVQIAATTAYKTNFVPGDFRGLGLTVQVGRPEPASGVVRPYTFSGVKVASWEFTCEDNAIPTLRLSVLGRDEATGTALATPVYVTGASVFSFAGATLKLGGTATTTAGETSVASGVAVSTIVRSITIRGETPMDADRFGLGNGGLRGEPLENDTPMVTGSLAAEFGKAELYDLYANNTTFALDFALVGDAIGASGHNFTFGVIIPATKLKAAAPQVDGPGIVQMTSDFEGYADGTNPPIQIQVKSDETAF